MDIHFALVESQDDLAWCLDDLIEGVTKMLAKTGRHGQSAEVMIHTMLKLAGTPFSFLLLARDDDRKFQGFCYAVLVKSEPSWVDFMGVYTRPGVASKVKYEAFALLKAWARSQGADRIMAGITRHYDTFFKFFHEPLGFRKIGIIVEYDLTMEG